MILAGDVGGTKCNLGLFETEERALRLVVQRKLATRGYAGFDALLEDFLKLAAAESPVAQASVIEGAGFGVAGVVVDGRHYSENLPWVLDAASLRRKLNLKNIVLLNDLAATAFSLEQLPADDLAPLNVGVPELKATRAVIAAGTGLGEAILFWDG
jgi:glucokinase